MKVEKKEKLSEIDLCESKKDENESGGHDCESERDSNKSDKGWKSKWKGVKIC